MDSKRCTGCDLIKPVTDFSKRSTARDGYRGQCRKCMCQSWKRRKDFGPVPVPCVEVRFWSKIDKSGPEILLNSPCWLWTGAKVVGYGVFTWDTKLRRVNRLMYEMKVGSIPDGLLVLHECDNPPCVNPDHLWVGTSLDNSLDMVRKGRSTLGDRNGMRKHPESVLRGDRHHFRLHPELHPRGEQCGSSKLTKPEVLEIRRAYSAGEGNITTLAKKFNMGTSQVKRIIRRESWAHI